MIDSGFFIGVVEDIYDPSEKNRVRVRIYGKHTENKIAIPTETLPWSNVVMPCTEASVTSVGSSHGLVQGSWVIGIYYDGDDENDALILGSLPSESTKNPNPDEGFQDPDGVHPYESGNDTPKAASTSQFKYDSAYQAKVANYISNIATATPPHLSTLDNDPSLRAAYYTPKTYDLPKPEDNIKPSYPKNRVKKSEAGHTYELDDTENFERISETHFPSGTYREIITDGTTTTVVRGKDYKVVFSDSNVYIKGACNITIDGEARTLVKGDYHLEVEGTMTQHVHGSLKTKAGAELKEIAQNSGLNIGQNQVINVGGNSTETINGTLNQKIVKDITLTGLANKYDTVMESFNITGGKASKISCGQKININTRVADVSGDVLAGNGNVSLITHGHPQPPTGPDAIGQGNTYSSIPNTGVGT